MDLIEKVKELIRANHLDYAGIASVESLRVFRLVREEMEIPDADKKKIFADNTGNLMRLPICTASLLLCVS